MMHLKVDFLYELINANYRVGIFRYSKYEFYKRRTIFLVR